MKFNFRYIFIVLLLFLAQIVEHGISTCYFCHWEMINICDCNSSEKESPDSCCSDCSESSSEAENPNNKDTLFVKSTSNQYCFSCISILPRINISNTYFCVAQEERLDSNIFGSKISQPKHISIVSISNISNIKILRI